MKPRKKKIVMPPPPSGPFGVEHMPERDYNGYVNILADVIKGMPYHKKKMYAKILGLG